MHFSKNIKAIMAGRGVWGLVLAFSVFAQIVTPVAPLYFWGQKMGLTYAATLPAAGVCPALPPPGGAVVRVATAGELGTAVNQAVPGVTILIADGYYNLF
ncbi:MAG: hypothetical protein AB1585_10765 [Thermodesulfobacteriota bacterium]